MMPKITIIEGVPDDQEAIDTIVGELPAYIEPEFNVSAELVEGKIVSIEIAHVGTELHIKVSSK